MKKITAVVLVPIILLTLTGCSFKNTNKSYGGDRYSADEILSESTDNDLSPENDVLTDLSDETVALLDKICKKYSADGVSAAFIKNNTLCSVYSYGTAVKEQNIPVCDDTKYRVASLSKLVTDIVFMQLVDNGLASSAANIEDYLGYKVRNPQFPDEIITPAMLMLHTSSLIDSGEFLNSRNSESSVPLEQLLGSPSSYTSVCPGKSYNYSNFGVAVLGAVCEKITGKCFDTLAHEYLFDVIGADAAYTASSLKHPELTGELYGSGGMTISKQMNERFCDEIAQTHHIVQGNLTVSAKDYAKILCLLMNDGISADGIQVISSDSVNEILKNQCQTATYGVGYGLQIQDNIIDGETVFVHTGSNFGMYSTYVFSNELDTGVVVLTSGAKGSKDSQNEVYDICLDIIRTLFEI